MSINWTEALNELLEKDLTGFKIVVMTEVFEVNEDGRKSKSIGFFKDPTVAKVFASAQTDATWHQTCLQPVLTNGVIGWVIGTKTPVKLFDDEKEAAELRAKAIAKLSPEERALLGLG